MPPALRAQVRGLHGALHIPFPAYFSPTKLISNAARMIPVVMEPGMRDPRQWFGPLAMKLGSVLYRDCSGPVSDEVITEIVDEIKKRM